MRKCPYCGRENEDEAPQCRECGTELPRGSDLEWPELTRPSQGKINLDDVEGAFVSAHGFSQPIWPVILKALRPFRSVEERQAAWLDVVSQWASRWEAELGAEFWMTRSGSFFLVSALDGQEAERILESANARADKIRRALGPLAWEDRPYILMVHVADEHVAERFDGAVSFEIPDTLVGRFVSDRFRGWILVCDQREGVITRDIEYELVWGCLAHLPLPRWLSTGIGHELFGPPTFDLDLVPMHRRFWNETTIQSFWAGTCWNDYPEQTSLGDDLGKILVHLLNEKSAQVLDFVRCANDYDGGQSAAQVVLNMDLGELAGTFLGPGHWAPDPFAIAECWDRCHESASGEQE